MDPVVKGAIKGTIKLGEEIASGAEVILFKMVSEGYSTVVANTKTDANGNYHFSNLDAGNYRLEIRYQIGQSLHETYVDAFPVGKGTVVQDVVMEKKEATALVFRVADGLGQPVEGAKVHATATTEETNWASEDITDANGEVILSSRYIFPVGTEVTYTVEKEGYETVTTTYKVVTEGRNEIQVSLEVVELEVQGTIEGIIKLEEEEAAGALVILIAEDTSNEIARTETGVNGKYVFENVKAGEYSLQIIYQVGYTIYKETVEPFLIDTGTVTRDVVIERKVKGDPIKGIYLNKDVVKPGDSILVQVEIDEKILPKDNIWSISIFYREEKFKVDVETHTRLEWNELTQMYEGEFEIDNVLYQGNYVLRDIQIMLPFEEGELENWLSITQEDLDFGAPRFTVENTITDLQEPVFHMYILSQESYSVGDQVQITFDIEEESRLITADIELEHEDGHYIELPIEWNEDRQTYEVTWNPEIEQIGKWLPSRLYLQDEWGNSLHLNEHELGELGLPHIEVKELIKIESIILDKAQAKPKERVQVQVKMDTINVAAENIEDIWIFYYLETENKVKERMGERLEWNPAMEQYEGEFYIGIEQHQGNYSLEKISIQLDQTWDELEIIITPQDLNIDIPQLEVENVIDDFDAPVFKAYTVDKEGYYPRDMVHIVFDVEDKSELSRSQIILSNGQNEERIINIEWNDREGQYEAVWEVMREDIGEWYAVNVSLRDKWGNRETWKEDDLEAFNLPTIRIVEEINEELDIEAQVEGELF